MFLYGGWRVVEGTLTLGTFAAFIAYQMRVMAPVQALMGSIRGWRRPRCRGAACWRLLDAPVDVREAPTPRRSPACAATLAFEHVSLTTERGVRVLDDV